MSFFNTYRNPALVKDCLDVIRTEAKKPIKLMEVCGGHTHAIQRYGLPSLLPSNIELLSGPGCPVCVTNRSYIDQAIHLASDTQNIICTYGDLLRVPGSISSLEKVKALGHSVEIVLSPLQCLEMAKQNPDKHIVFLGIGFETTAPATAATILEAEKKKIKNFSVFSAHKTMPAAMKALAGEQPLLNGYICPGHVSSITGARMYSFLPEKHGIACVIAGFEPLDLLECILMLIRQVNSNHPKVQIQYKRAVTINGNKKAQQILEKVFKPVNDYWRGLGRINGSGLAIENR
ncbi:MAG: hydrogenase formation protein HypD, partial [Bacteroidetes bacterium]|nr:hydrogenase formation protein HypD [Bacteroidota bacterium]